MVYWGFLNLENVFANLKLISLDLLNDWFKGGKDTKNSEEDVDVIFIFLVIAFAIVAVIRQSIGKLDSNFWLGLSLGFIGLVFQLLSMPSADWKPSPVLEHLGWAALILAIISLCWGIMRRAGSRL